MSPLQSLRDGLTDESLRVAILVGVASIPFTVLLSLDRIALPTVIAGGSASGGPLLAAGIAVGYYYSSRTTSSRRAGVWTGLAGSPGVVAVFVANAVSTMSGDSPRLTVLAAVLAPVTVAIGVGLSVLMTTVAAQITDWTVMRLRRERPTGRRDGNADEDEGVLEANASRLLALYAVATPPGLGYVLLVGPSDGVGFLVSFVATAGLTVLSLVVFVALFLDVTARRAVGTARTARVGAYVVGPLVAYAAVYLAAALRSASYPPGYAHYGFLIALWLSTAVYLLEGWRRATAG